MKMSAITMICKVLARLSLIYENVLEAVAIFSEEDLSGNLTSNFEWTFIQYLCKIKQSMNKITETTDSNRKLCEEYIARGLGLFSGEQHQKAVFYLYPDDFENSEPSKNRVIINIKGPFGTYGNATISKITKIPSEKSSEESSIYNSASKTKNVSYFIEKIPWFFKHCRKLNESHKNIVIDVTLEKNRAKVSYIPNNYGMHEINLICNGELLRGCPFNVHIFSNKTKTKDNLESEERKEGLRYYQKRKIISGMVDLIDQKIPLSGLQEKCHIILGDNIKKDNSIKSTHISKEISEETTKRRKNSENTFKVDIDDKKETCEKMESLKMQGFAESLTNTELQCDKIVELSESNGYIDNQIFICSIPAIEVTDQYDLFQNYDIENENNFNNNAKSRFIKNLGESWEPKYNMEIQIPVIDGINKVTDINVNLDEGNEKSEFISEKKIDISIEIGNTHNLLENFRRYSQQGPAFEVSKSSDSSNQLITFTSDELIKNKQKIDSMFPGEKLMNIVHHLYEFEKNCDFQNISRYVNIKKIRIPTKFLTNQQKLVKINLDASNTKYFEKICCDSVVSYTDTKETEDVNNNYNNCFHTKYTQSKQHEPESVIYQPQEKYEPCLSCDTENTSPICSDHIVNEVERSDISVAERIKMFAQNSLKSISSLENSSFSENESVEGSANKRHHQIVELSVLNILDSLKKSVSVSNDEIYLLSSTISLPNISLNSHYSSSKVVKEKKTYWENMSSYSSMSSRSLSSKSTLKKNEQNEHESDLLPLKKNNVPDTKRRENLRKDIYKSADDILAMTESLNHKHSKEFKSVDDCLNMYELLTIEERKQMLLKQNYEKEKLARNRMMLMKKHHIRNYSKPIMVFKQQNGASISPVMEKIRKFNSAYNLSMVKENDNKQKIESATNNKVNNVLNIVSPKSSIIRENDSNTILSKPEPKIRYKSQFNRAMKYFKKLEESSQGEPESKISKISRQLFLKVRTERNREREKGGSLNISERFSINNLYEDITQNKRGRLKGTPNRMPLVETLATFPRRENQCYNICVNDNDIKSKEGKA